MKIVKITLGIILMLVFLGMNDALGQWAFDGSNIHNTNTGNVGIGSFPAATLLHVQKNMTEPNIRVQNLGGTGGATFQMVDNASGADWKFKATNAGGFKIRDNASALDIIQVEPGSTANAIYIKSGGNVGIRTTNPVANFQVAEAPFGYTGAFGTPVNAYTGGTNVAIGDDNSSSLLYVGQNTSDKGFLIWQFNQSPANAYYSVGTFNGSHPLVLQEIAGNVGIRTTTPSALLDVRTNANNYCWLGYTNSSANYLFHSEDPTDGDGQTDLYAYRTRSSDNSGVGYYNGGTNQGISGYSNWGDLYSFGTTGFNYNDYSRCGGVLGAEKFGAYWGALGYKDSGGTPYGVYASGATWGGGGGKSSQPAQIGIGLGAWGDLMGANIHGKIYGIYAEGENYALFSNGDVYKTKLDIHLQENGSGTNTALYTNVSTDVTIMTTGTATLSQGRASIAFDKAFTECVSSEEPVVVTVTPTGSSNGVFLSQVTSTGFTVQENNAGKSSVTVNYIAVGKRAGYEQPRLSKEVIETGYTGKLARGLHDDADTQTKSEGLYYENGQLVVGIHPSTLPDPNKPAEKSLIPTVKAATTGDNPAGKLQDGRL
jgi:hypothetical protein